MARIAVDLTAVRESRNLRMLLIGEVFSGLGARISTHNLKPFLDNMHTALWCLCAVSIVGAVISAARPKDVAVPAAEKPREPQAALS